VTSPIYAQINNDVPVDPKIKYERTFDENKLRYENKIKFERTFDDDIVVVYDGRNLDDQNGRRTRTDAPPRVKGRNAGGSHDEADAEWIVIRRPFRSHNDAPLGRQPLAGLSAARGLATLKAYLVILVTLNE
jgi:hypothetical protein